MRNPYQNLLTASTRRGIAISISLAGALVAAFGRGAAGQAASTDSIPARTTVVAASGPIVRVQIDSANREAVIIVSPLRIPAATTYNHHFAPPPTAFIWPATGAVQGFRIELLDSTGQPLPRQLLHHAGVTNLDRRQLPYPIAERLFAAGVESDPVTLPGSVGVPLSEGNHMLVYYALANSSSHDVNGAILRIRMPWKPDGRDNPRPVLPMYFDVLPNIGAPNTFDVGPGLSTTSAEFVLPAAGHLKYLGGHLHQYGVELRLEDVQTNKVLARLRSVRNPDGTIRSIQRQRFYFRRNGLGLHADHRYRIVAVYDNPTCAAVPGSMGLLVAIFAPDDISTWPAVDVTNAAYQKDIAWFLEAGSAEANETHEHGSEVAVAASSTKRCGQ